MKKLFVLALLLVISSTANASFMSGNNLMERYRSYKEYNAGNPSEEDLMLGMMYLGYVAGASDVLDNLEMICKPKGMTVGQAAQIVGKYLDDNPQELHISAGTLVFKALSEHYPCKK